MELTIEIWNLFYLGISLQCNNFIQPSADKQLSSSTVTQDGIYGISLCNSDLVPQWTHSNQMQQKTAKDFSNYRNIYPHISRGKGLRRPVSLAPTLFPGQTEHGRAEKFFWGCPLPLPAPFIKDLDEMLESSTDLYYYF